MKEIWKTVNGFPNYQISNMGRLKRLEHYTERPAAGNKNIIVKYYYCETIRSEFHKVGKMIGKYYYTWLSDPISKRREKFLLHRLVAEAFVDNPRGLNEVDHIDRNPENNRADNLRWCTHSENCRNQGPRKKPKKYEHSEEFYRNHPNYKRKD